MKTIFIRATLFATFALITLPGLSLAETGPAKTVEQIVQSIKSAGNASGVVDYVNWKKAYEQLPEVQKQQLQIDTPEKMKAFFKEMLTSPAQTMKKQMQARLATVPADKQEIAKQSVERMEKMMQDKEAEMKDRIANTEYKVSEEKITGTQATVKLTQVFKGEPPRIEEVKLEKEGDKWLLPALNSMGSGNTAGGPPSPAAGGNAAAGNPGAGAAPVSPAPSGTAKLDAGK